MHVREVHDRQRKELARSRLQKRWVQAMNQRTQEMEARRNVGGGGGERRVSWGVHMVQRLHSMSTHAELGYRIHNTDFTPLTPAAVAVQCGIRCTRYCLGPKYRVLIQNWAMSCRIIRYGPYIDSANPPALAHPVCSSICLRSPRYLRRASVLSNSVSPCTTPVCAHRLTQTQ